MKTKDLKGSRLSYYMSRDYSNTLIYKVACTDPAVSDFYLGYITFSLSDVCEMLHQRCKRDSWHLCVFIRENGGFQNWGVERLSSISCTSSLEARTELGKHFDASPRSLNKKLPTRTHQQYAKTGPKANAEGIQGETREKIILDQREIYQRNKEKLSIKRRAYFLANRDAINGRLRAYRAKLKQACLEEAATAASAPQPASRPAVS